MEKPIILNETRLIDLTVNQFEFLISRTVKNNFQEEAKAKLGNLQKEFYSPKEFSSITGIPYSTIVHRCNTGKLKAHQDDPGCSWQILVSELERYKSEANNNTI